MIGNAPPGWIFMGPYIVPVAPRVLVSEIKTKVAAYYQLPRRAMSDRSRFREHSHPRQVAMYLSRYIALRTLPDIAKRFGRDHTTVMHALRAVEARRRDDPKLNRDILLLTAQLEGISHLLKPVGVT